MSDSYTQFSEGLRATKADVKWIEAKIDYFKNPPSSDGDEWDDFVAECDAYEIDDPEHSSLEFEVDYLKGQVVFYSDEQGNPYHVAKLIQDLFRERYPDACFSIGWSATCSRPKMGEFGGGALFVTAKEIEFSSTFDWLEEKGKDFERTKS